jgi:hypothetical protein
VYFPAGDYVVFSISTIHAMTNMEALGGNYASSVNRGMKLNELGKLGLQTDKQTAGTGVAYNYQAAWDRLVRADSVNTSNCMFSDPFGWACDTTITSTRSYSYDSVGNRRDNAALYDAATNSRLTSFGTAGALCTYAYDADGNTSLEHAAPPLHALSGQPKID